MIKATCAPILVRLAALNGVALLIAFILCSRPMPTHTAARAVHLHPRDGRSAGVIDL
jgi:hypothetical protein